MTAAIERLRSLLEAPEWDPGHDICGDTHARISAALVEFDALTAAHAASEKALVALAREVAEASFAAVRTSLGAMAFAPEMEARLAEARKSLAIPEAAEVEPIESVIRRHRDAEHSTLLGELADALGDRAANGTFAHQLAAVRGLKMEHESRGKQRDEQVARIATLTADVERLTKERDEHKARGDREVEQHTATVIRLSDAKRAVEAERDTATSALTAATGRLEALDALVKRATTRLLAGHAKWKETPDLITAGQYAADAISAVLAMQPPEAALAAEPAAEVAFADDPCPVDARQLATWSRGKIGTTYEAMARTLAWSVRRIDALSGRGSRS